VRLTTADRTNGLLVRFKPLKARPSRLPQMPFSAGLLGGPRMRSKQQVADRTWATSLSSRGSRDLRVTGIAGDKVVADHNVRRGRGVERRFGLSGGEASEGRTP
jgi:hypothetical protein